MLEKIRNLGINSDTIYAASILSVLLSIVAWFVQRDDQPNAERFGIFVGLWAPTLMILGKVLDDAETA